MVRARRPVGDDLVADDPALDPQTTGVGRAAPEADVVGAVTVLEGRSSIGRSQRATAVRAAAAAGLGLELVVDTDQEAPGTGDRPDEAADRAECDPVEAAAPAIEGDDRDGADDPVAASA